MTEKILTRMLFLIGFALLLAACLGEPELPDVGDTPPLTLVSPSADATIAAQPRISIRFDNALMVEDQQVPQIPHDMIGRSDCLMCHKQGISEAPRIPDSHRGLNNDACLGCHTAPVSAELSGEEMYSRICARCHGENGEGGYGPTLNSKSFLSRVSDDGLRAAIAQGRGAEQMLAWGDLGLLTERQIDEIVLLIRRWETTAPQDGQSSVSEQASAERGDPATGEVQFAQYCSGCHGLHGEVEVGQGLYLSQVIHEMEDTAIAQVIRDGDDEMPSFHAILTTDDISDLLAFIRTLAPSSEELAVEPSFSKDLLPLFTAKCAMCHGTSGEWVATSYSEAMESGDHAPNIIPGDPEASPLVQRLRGTQVTGGIMPPGKPLAENEIELIVRWIAAGAQDN